MASRDPIGPEGKWPTHPQKDLNNVLVEARARGWSYKRGTSHGGGRVYCPAGECRVRIDSTPKSPTFVARNALREMRNCDHGKDPAPALFEAAHKMDQAEALIGGVEKFINYREQLEDLEGLEGSCMTAEEVTEAIEAAAELEAEVSNLLGGVDGVDAQNGYHGAEELLSVARSLALPLVGGPSRVDEASAAMSRHRQVKDRLQGVKNALKRALKSP